MAAAADVELRWPLAEQAASVAIDRGRDEQSLVPLVRLPGDVTAYRDPSPPDGPKLCYRVRPMTSDDRAIEEFMRCLTPDAAPEAPGNDTPGDAPPGDDPTRWRGLEGWYQSVPLPPQPPETGS